MSYKAGEILNVEAQVLTLADGLLKTTGTVYAVIRLDQPGDADDGKVWDTDAGGSWQTTPTTLPTLTSGGGDYADGWWRYPLPAAATTGREGANVASHMTDNAADPASELARSGPTTYPLEPEVAPVLGTSSAVTAQPFDTDSYTLTTGTQSAGTVANIGTADGVHHEHTDVGGVLDLEYTANIGAGVPSTINVLGRLNGSNDSLTCYLWNWNDSQWDAVGTYAGTALAEDSERAFPAYATHVGSGANQGDIRFRFAAASGLTSATLRIDRIYVSYSRPSSGYEGGAMWFDSSASNTDTTPEIDGVPSKPVSTAAALLTLSAKTKLKRVEVAPGSTLQLSAAFDGFVLAGRNWTLDLNGQSISATHVVGAKVTGTATGASPPSFGDCVFDAACTLPPCTLDTPGLGAGGLTAGGAGDYYINEPRSRIPGSGAPVFNAASNAINLSVRALSGGFTFQNVVAGTVATIGGPDLGTVTITGADGEVSIRGVGKPPDDQRTGSPTLDTTGLTNPAAVDTTLTASHGAGSWSSSGLSGSENITLRSEEADLTTIPEVECTIRDASNTAKSGVVKTSPGGTVLLPINPGTYWCNPYRAGYVFTAFQFVVTGDATVKVIGAPVAITPPSLPNVCNVGGKLVGPDGAPLVGAVIQSIIEPETDNAGQHVAGVTLSNPGLYSAVITDASGDFVLPLVRTARMRIKSPAARIDAVVTCPDLATEDFDAVMATAT